MNNKQYITLYALLCTSTALGNAITNHTFLAPRPVGINLATEYTTGLMHPPIQDHQAKHTTKLGVTGFYSQSQAARHVGNYFGIGNGSNSITFGNVGPIPAWGASRAATTPADLNTFYLVHDAAAGGTITPNSFVGSVELSPQQAQAGARFDLMHTLSWWPKLFVRATMPVVTISTHLHPTMTTIISSDPGVTGKAYTITDLFAGKLQSDVATNLQLPLTHAKIDGSKRSRSGIADIDLGIGYRCISDQSGHLLASLDLTIPTGTKQPGTYLFEPLVGNGRHVGVGGSLDSAFELLNNDKATITLLSALRYRYLFSSQSMRTLPLKGLPWSHYYLAGKVGAAAGTPLQPAANLTTQPVAVTPGSVFDSMLALNFSAHGFSFDAGYTLFWKAREGVSAPTTLPEDMYAVADPIFSTDTPFPTRGAVASSRLINRSTLNLEAIATPAQCSHKLFGGLGYSLAINRQCSGLVAVGSSYEFAGTNNELENYALWAKAIISF
jgi:hypothetical protein